MRPRLGKAVMALAESSYEIRDGTARIKRRSSLRVERHGREQQVSRVRNRSGLLKFAARADLVICFVIIPVGAFIGARWGIKPITISLVGLTAVFIMACMRVVRNFR